MRSYTGLLGQTLHKILFLTRSHGLYKSSAHKAAYPDRYPITDSTRALYPSLISIEDRCKATSVHLQVYDGKILLSILNIK